jgi:uncharacterized surface protein with fasciclin (FAS1) repeats
MLLIWSPDPRRHDGLLQRLPNGPQLGVLRFVPTATHGTHLLTLRDDGADFGSVDDQGAWAANVVTSEPGMITDRAGVNTSRVQSRKSIAMRSRVVAAAVVAGVGLAAAACGSGGGTPSASGPHHRETRHALATKSAEARAAARRHGAFGVGCAKVPATGAGSLTAMASEPVATAAAHTPLLHDFSRAVRAAGLTSMLNSAKAITVFAPDNAAFIALGEGNVATLTATRPDLTKVLEYHVVSGRRTPAQLASHRHLTTLRGTVIIPVKSHKIYEVNSVEITCGNIQTANATVYIVSGFLVPLP